MVAVGKHLSATAQYAIHGPRYAHREALDSTSKGHGVICLGDQVQVIRLHREMSHAEAFALASLADAGRHDTEAFPRPEAASIVAHARSHVDGVPRSERGAVLWR